MGYKAKVNLCVGKYEVNAGAPYEGPSEDIERLLQEGLIEQDASVSSEPVKGSEPEDLEIFEAPKKGKGKRK